MVYSITLSFHVTSERILNKKEKEKKQPPKQINK
jgi:hypothetical protein